MQDKMFGLGSNTACLRLPLHQQGLSTLAGTGKYRTSAKRQESHGANAKDYPWLRGKEELQYMPKKKPPRNTIVNAQRSQETELGYT